MQIEAKKAVDRECYKQPEETKYAICWKSSDTGPPKAARFHDLQIRSPINLFIDRAEEVKSTAEVLFMHITSSRSSISKYN